MSKNPISSKPCMYSNDNSITIDLDNLISPPQQQRHFLFVSIKKHLVSSLCIAAMFATREVLGFEKTAIMITTTTTAFGFVSFGLLSTPLAMRHNLKVKSIHLNALLGASIGFTVSLLALAVFESSFQMFQKMKEYID